MRADGAGIGAHRDGMDAHAREGPQVGGEHDVIGPLRALEVEIEGIGVLHIELAPAHDAEARPDLVAKLPLDVIEDSRQVAVAPDGLAEDLGDLVLVGRPIEHLSVVPVADPQHLRTIGVVATALAPQIGGLDRRHQEFLGAGAIHLLAHDRLDVLQDTETQRQP